MSYRAEEGRPGSVHLDQSRCGRLEYCVYALDEEIGCHPPPQMFLVKELRRAMLVLSAPDKLALGRIDVWLNLYIIYWGKSHDCFAFHRLSNSNPFLETGAL